MVIIIPKISGYEYLSLRKSKPNMMTNIGLVFARNETIVGLGVS